MVICKMPPSGDNYEREIERRLWINGFATFRVAGSGTVAHASADIIAIKNGDVLVLDVKSICDYPVDVSDTTVQLKVIRDRSNVLPKYALKFKEEMGWRYCNYDVGSIHGPENYEPMYKLLENVG